MTTQQDDFLTQVLEVEESATQKKEKAKDLSRIDARKYEKTLEGEREKALSLAKGVSKEKLQAKQASAKELYQKMVKEGEKEATTLKKEAEKEAEKILVSTQGFFLNEIL